VFPNDKHKFKAGWRAAQKTTVGCGKDLAAEKSSLPACTFPQPSLCAARQPTLMCSSLARPVVQPAGLPFVLQVDFGKFMFFIWQHGLPALFCVIP